MSASSSRRDIISALVSVGIMNSSVILIRVTRGSHGAARGAKTGLMTDGLSFVVTLFLCLSGL